MGGQTDLVVHEQNGLLFSPHNTDEFVRMIALMRFRARPGDLTEPPQVHGNRRLELIWTATPAGTPMLERYRDDARLRAVHGAEAARLARERTWPRQVEQLRGYYAAMAPRVQTQLLATPA